MSNSAISSGGEPAGSFARQEALAADSGVESFFNKSIDKAGVGGVSQKPVAEVARKIIYNATINLIVEDLDASEKTLRELIDKHHGRISSSDNQGSSGAQRSGRWRIRIPIDQFDVFKAAVEKIGNLERSAVDSKDVTEEYYDIEARLKNKKVEETRLINHLEKTTGKLSDILEVERELSRVRGEIEQLQGKMNVLTNLSSLTTVDVFIREIKNYVPPTAPTYGEEASRTFAGSWDRLLQTGRSISLNLISIVPWLPLWLVVGVVFYRPMRKFGRWFWAQSGLASQRPSSRGTEKSPVPEV